MKKSDPTNHNDRGQAAAQQFEAEYARDEDLVLVEPLMVKDFRRLLADQTVKNWSQWATVAGFIPVPLLDLVAISSVQIKMIYDLCKVYDVPFEQRQVRAILSGLAGGGITTVASTAISGTLIKSVPIIGSTLAAVTQPVMSYATTYAVGTIFVRHFESNGTLMSMSIDAIKSTYQEQVAYAKKMFLKKNAAEKSANVAATPI
jgi:uncharacterized protein (DUF697 family)